MPVMLKPAQLPLPARHLLRCPARKCCRRIASASRMTKREGSLCGTSFCLAWRLQRTCENRFRRHRRMRIFRSHCLGCFLPVPPIAGWHRRHIHPMLVSVFGDCPHSEGQSDELVETCVLVMLAGVGESDIGVSALFTNKKLGRATPEVLPAVSESHPVCAHR